MGRHVRANSLFGKDSPNKLAKIAKIKVNTLHVYIHKNI